MTMSRCFLLEAVSKLLSGWVLKLLLVLLAGILLADARPALPANAPPGPIRVRPERFYPVLMPGGAVWGVSIQALAEGHMAVTTVESTDGGQTWRDRRTLVELPKVEPPTTVWGDGVP